MFIKSKNGQRVIKLEAAERRALVKAMEVLDELGKQAAEPLDEWANGASERIDYLLGEFPEKPAEPAPASTMSEE